MEGRKKFCFQCRKYGDDIKHFDGGSNICIFCQINSESISPPKAKAMGIPNARTI